MDKTTITKFYPYQKKSSSGIHSIDDIKRLNRKTVSLETENVDFVLPTSQVEKNNVESSSSSTKSPLLARVTRSSARNKAAKPVSLTRRQSSSKSINDYFKSQPEEDSEQLLLSLKVSLKEVPLTNNEGDDNCVLSSLEEETVEKSSLILKDCDETPGFVTSTKSKSSLLSSPHKRRFVATNVESSTTKDEGEEKTTLFPQNGEKTDSKSRSVRKRLSLGDEEVLKDEEVESVNVIKKPKSVIDLNVTKASLSKCGKLQELQKHLLKMKELKEQHNQITKAAKSPVKSPLKKSSVKSPVKLTRNEATPPSPNKAPAYEKFKHLILPSVPTLTLPNSYTLLEDFFKSTDTVVSMLFNRSEVCTLTKVKAAVQEMAKRNFESKVLAQIKTVYPCAYDFKQEKGLPKCGYKYQGHQLTLTPLFDAINSKDASEEKAKFTSSDILRRQKIFHNNLVTMVKKKHKVFLQSQNLCIPDEKLVRWHPRFRLDEIAEIEPTALPEPPYMKVYQTAKDVLDDTKARLHPKVKTALENVAAASAQQTPVIPPTPESNSKKEELKGIPQGLLARIRAKEAQRLEESITRSPAQDQKTKMLDRLPEISRILRTYFVTEKKPAMLFDHLLERISQSYKSPISKADVENHLKLLLEVAPNWITVANTMKGKYIKLDKTVKMQNIQEKINQHRKSL